MKRHNVLILAMLFIVMAIAVSCKSEPQTQPLSEDDKALIDSVVGNVALPDSSGHTISAKSFITYVKEDLNKALSLGLRAGNIVIKGSVTDVPVVKLEISLVDFTPAEGDKNLASAVIVIGDDPSIESGKIYKIEARDKDGTIISDEELDDIVSSNEFVSYIFNNLKNGLSVNGSNIEVSLNANPAFDGSGEIKSLDAKLSIKMKNQMVVDKFKYSGSAEAVLNATFKPDSEIAAAVADSLSIKVSFNLNIYDGAKDHTVSGILNLAFPGIALGKFIPDPSFSSFSIDGRAINGDEALKYIESKITVK